MEGSAIDVVIFAPLAPILGVFLFWFIQLAFIESEKYLLDKIRAKHQPLCRFTNLNGDILQYKRNSKECPLKASLKV